MHTLNSNNDDRLQWKWKSSGTYTAASLLNKVYQDQYVRTLPPKVTEFIWKRKSPPRALLTLWFLARGRLKCGELLNQLNILPIEETKCPWCNKELETLDHLFFAYGLSWKLSCSSFRWRNISTALHKEVIQNILG